MNIHATYRLIRLGLFGIALSVAWIAIASAVLLLELNSDSAKHHYETSLNAIVLPPDFSLIDSTFEEGGPLVAATLTRRYRVHGTRVGVLEELRSALRRQGYEMQGNDLSDYHTAVKHDKHPGFVTIRFRPLDPHRVNPDGSVEYLAHPQYPTDVDEVSIQLSP